MYFSLAFASSPTYILFNNKVQMIDVKTTTASSLPPLKNPDFMDFAEDLAQISYLHEPAVFSGLKNRFIRRDIYTYSGIVLIAMNPFFAMDLYSTDIMREYIGKRRDELEPHLVGPFSLQESLQLNPFLLVNNNMFRFMFSVCHSRRII
jgi:myosin heavy subunit